jgi:hypothetical protein
MGSKEYLLLAMVILVPLIIAVVVTLWTLEQARLRSKQNRPRPARPTDLLSDDPVEPMGDAEADTRDLA